MANTNNPGSSSGRTVKARKLQYVPRPADAELLDHCQNVRPAYILHSPQMGKSSLITNAAEQLNASSHHAVLIDLSQFPLPPREAEWFHKIVRILDDNLDLTTDVLTWWEKPEVFAIPPHIRLTQLITEVILPELSRPLILFIDEIERMVSLPYREHFFEWLTTLYESRATNSDLYRFSFVLCGVATPSQLIPEGGPLLFQWSHRVVLSDFTLSEALLLAEGLSLPTQNAHEAIHWIYRWTNGHPYLTQLLCQLLEEQLRTTWFEAEVDECILNFIESPQTTRDPHFQFIRTALTEPDSNGVTLLEPYLALLEENVAELQAKPAALEQLQLIGVVRENENIIRNDLYRESFPPDWVKRHLRPVPFASESPVSPLLSPKHSYVLAASLIFVGLALLVWSFRGGISTPQSKPRQEVTSISTKGDTASSQKNESAPIASQPKVSSQDQEKIQSLEATIVEYQRLSNEKLENLTKQRTQLETQFHAQETTLSELRTELKNVKEELLEQQQTAQEAEFRFDSERERLESALASATNQRISAQEEAKSLQSALLKKSSLSPAEIKDLIADRNQVESKLSAVQEDLAKAQEKTRTLTTSLAQGELQAKSDEKRFERDRAQLQTQLNTLQTELQKTRESLKQAEHQAEGQHTLAQQELTRLQQERSSIQEELKKNRLLLTQQQNRLSTLEKESTEYRQDLQKALEAKTTLEAQLEHSQQAETQLQNRVAQLEIDSSQNQERNDAQRLTFQRERDHLSQELTKFQAELEAKNNHMTTLETQLSATKQELANRQVALRDIHATSSEKTRLADSQLTALLETRTNLESQLREKEQSLTQANLRITELENLSSNAGNLTQDLDKSKKEARRLSAKLASTQQQLETLQESLKRSPSLDTEAKNAFSVTTQQIHQVLPLITTELASPSTDSLSETSKLMLARQAFLFSVRSNGGDRASIDHFLRKGLHTSPIHLQGVSGRVHALTFDPTGDHLIAGTSEGAVLMWSMNRPSNSPQKMAGHSAGVVSVSVSPDGQRLASGSLDSTIRVWALFQSSNPPQILQGHTKGVTNVAFNPDGKQLASGSHDQTVRLWDLLADKQQSVILGKHDGRVNAIAYSPDGKTLFSGSDDLTIRVWDLQRIEGQPKILHGHQQSISTIGVHPSGWILATGSRDRQIGIWNLRQPVVSPTFLTGSRGRISGVQFSKSGEFVASVSSDKSLRIWNWQEPSQPPIHIPDHKGTLEALAQSPDGQTIAVGGSSQSITLWAGTEQLAHAVCDTAKENLSFQEWKRILGDAIPYERTCPNLPLHPTFLEEGRRLAKQGAHQQARKIFERAKLLDSSLKFDLEDELKKLSAKSS